MMQFHSRQIKNRKPARILIKFILDGQNITKFLYFFRNYSSNEFLKMLGLFFHVSTNKIKIDFRNLRPKRF